jgi:hypothetical protein
MKFAAVLVVVLVACGSKPGVGDDDVMTGDGSNADPDAAPARINTVFVIPMENKANSVIYGNTADAPYLNGLLATAAHATKFGDVLPTLPSEPHYVWMEAGTNAFADRTFTNDNDPSATNTTASTAHLVTQLVTAGVPWMAYQEGITSGTCPIASSGHYAAKHDPFVFFKDVVGSPPSTTTPACATHHKSYADFAADLAAGITGYVFITPNECNDMHGALDCPSGISSSANIKAGDTWLQAELPRIIAYAETHEAVIFITWDEGDSSNVVPLFVLGKHVKVGTTSTTTYSHSSLVKSIEELLDVPVLPSVTSANDFADMFDAGTFN